MRLFGASALEARNSSLCSKKMAAQAKAVATAEQAAQKALWKPDALCDEFLDVCKCRGYAAQLLKY
jgi:hypothetical protein